MRYQFHPLAVQHRHSLHKGRGQTRFSRVLPQVSSMASHWLTKSCSRPVVHGQGLHRHFTVMGSEDLPTWMTWITPKPFPSPPRILVNSPTLVLKLNKKAPPPPPALMFAQKGALLTAWENRIEQISARPNRIPFPDYIIPLYISSNQ